VTEARKLHRQNRRQKTWMNQRSEKHDLLWSTILLKSEYILAERPKISNNMWREYFQGMSETGWQSPEIVEHSINKNIIRSTILRDLAMIQRWQDRKVSKSRNWLEWNLGKSVDWPSSRSRQELQSNCPSKSASLFSLICFPQFLFIK
jgi:hypothetical protein